MEGIKEYPIFKNNIAFIDHTYSVNQETAEAWKQNGIKKIKTLSSGIDHIKQNALSVENWDGTIEPTVQWCLKKLFDWAYWPEIPIEIFSKKVFIIGQKGRIGGRVYDVLLNLGNWKTIDNVDVIDFETISEYQQFLKNRIPEKDIIFLCINPEGNDNFWDKEKLEWMKKDAILITPSRPSILSPEALKDLRVIWDSKHEAWKTDACIKRKQEAVL